MNPRRSSGDGGDADGGGGGGDVVMLKAMTMGASESMWGVPGVLSSPGRPFNRP